MRLPWLRATYSRWRGEASRRALAQSCAWMDTVAKERSRTPARSLRTRGTVDFMGSILVHGTACRKSEVDSHDCGFIPPDAQPQLMGWRFCIQEAGCLISRCVTLITDWNTLILYFLVSAEGAFLPWKCS